MMMIKTAKLFTKVRELFEISLTFLLFIEIGRIIKLLDKTHLNRINLKASKNITEKGKCWTIKILRGDAVLHLLKVFY